MTNDSPAIFGVPSNEGSMEKNHNHVKQTQQQAQVRMRGWKKIMQQYHVLKDLLNNKCFEVEVDSHLKQKEFVVKMIK